MSTTPRGEQAPNGSEYAAKWGVAGGGGRAERGWQSAVYRRLFGLTRMGTLSLRGSRESALADHDMTRSSSS
jgi:hypothetical protein